MYQLCSAVLAGLVGLSLSSTTPLAQSAPSVAHDVEKLYMAPDAPPTACAERAIRNQLSVTRWNDVDLTVGPPQSGYLWSSAEFDAREAGGARYHGFVYFRQWAESLGDETKAPLRHVSVCDVPCHHVFHSFSLRDETGKEVAFDRDNDCKSGPLG